MEKKHDRKLFGRILLQKSNLCDKIIWIDRWKSPTSPVRKARYQTFEAGWRASQSSEASNMLHMVSNQVEQYGYYRVFYGYFGVSDENWHLVYDRNVKTTICQAADRNIRTTFQGQNSFDHSFVFQKPVL